MLYALNHDIEPDDRDAGILETLAGAWAKREGPRVGDFIQMLDGSLRRFTYDWGDGLQTTLTSHPVHGTYGGSFYFGHGAMSYSGGLDHEIPNESIQPTGEAREGRAWFFHHGHPGAHRGVGCKTPCRVFTQTEGVAHE